MNKIFTPIYLIFFTFLFETENIFAQEIRKIDSFKTQLNLVHSDSVKVDILKKIAWEYRNIQPESTVFYGFKAAKLAEQKGFSDAQIEAEAFAGVGYRNLGNLDKALEIFIKNRDFAQYLDLKVRLGYSYLNIGNIYLRKDDYNRSIQNVILGIQTGEKMKDSVLMGYGYINLARIYVYAEDYENAVIQYQKVLKIRKSLNDKYGIAVAKLEMGVCLMQLNRTDEAIGAMSNALKDFQNLGSDIDQAVVYEQTGKLYTKKKEFDRALEILNKGLYFSNKAQSRDETAKLYQNIAYAYFLKNDFPTSEKNYHIAAAIADSLHIIGVQSEVSKVLSIIYLKKSDYKNAYLQLSIYNNLKDSLINISNLKKYSKLDMNYKFEQDKQTQKFIEQQNELKHAEQLKRFVIFVILLTVLLILSILFVFYLYRSRKTVSTAKDLLEEKNREISLKNREITEFNAKLEQANEEIKVTLEKTENVNQEVELISTAVNQCGSAIAILDKDGDFEWVNPPFDTIFGLNLEEFKSGFGTNIINKTTPKEHISKIEKCIFQNITAKYEFSYRNENNQKKQIYAVLTSYINFDKKQKKIIAVFTDISEPELE
jgi:tetratricopeptide (TPR) repeat protein